ncbi:MAG TPA: DUF4350 domain-containing protein [Gemmatimonadales bacterium]|nr:DUF4350 domain-containing protein [Gemmatimonadales bacterium]
MSYRLEIGLAALLAVSIGLALWAGSRNERTPDFDLRASTFLNGPYGSKGLHDVLLQLGRRSERRRTSLDDLATERAHRPAILVLNAPTIPLDDDEVSQVVRFLRGGGAVVATGTGGGVTGCAGWRTQPFVGQEDSMAVSGEAGLRLPQVTRVLTPLEAEEQPTTVPLASLRKGEAEDETLGICKTLVPFAVDTVIAALNTRPVILTLRYRGGGSLTLVGDRRWLTNRMWRDTDVPIVVLPLLTPRRERPGRVVWDEYHQGFSETKGPTLAGSTWRWMRGSPAGWAMLQLCAVALLWLAMTAVRFGPARDVIERRRRSPLEHLEALGSGLESADDGDTAVRRLALGLRRRLSRAIPTRDENVLPWLEGLELATRGTKGRAAVRRLQHLITARDPGAESARVLSAAQAVEDVWEELRPRPPQTRNGS